MDYIKNKTSIEAILLSSDIETAIRDNEQLLFELIPELKAEKGFEQKSEWHCYDVWEHTIHAIISSKADAEIRLILLLHDIGKPYSCQEDGNVRHFRGHAEKSAEIAQTALKRLGYPSDKIDEYCFYIGKHANTITEDMLNDENIGKYIKLLQIQYCDSSAYAPKYAKQIIEKLDAIKLMLETYKSRK